jgi:hypothetical protein
MYQESFFMERVPGRVQDSCQVDAPPRADAGR